MNEREMMNPSNGLIGIRYDVKKWLKSVFIAYASSWTLLEPIVSFLSPNLSGPWKYTVFILASLLLGTAGVWPKRKIVLSLPHTSTTISIEFNDIFKVNGHKVIAVNEYFDSEIGQIVSPRSLHGVFLTKILGGHVEPFDSSVGKIPDQYIIESVHRTKGKAKRFCLGTTTDINHGESKYFLFALTRTDNNYKAYCTPAMMMEALAGLWNYVRDHHNGDDVVIPLVGSKLAGVGLSAPQLLELIVLSIVDATKKRELSTHVKIVLLPDFIEEINLRAEAQKWR